MSRCTDCGSRGECEVFCGRDRFEMQEDIDLAEAKVEKLRGLLFLTDESVSNFVMNTLTQRQRISFWEAFPDERPRDEEEIK